MLDQIFKIAVIVAVIVWIAPAILLNIMLYLFIKAKTNTAKPPKRTAEQTKKRTNNWVMTLTTLGLEFRQNETTFHVKTSKSPHSRRMLEQLFRRMNRDGFTVVVDE